MLVGSASDIVYYDSSLSRDLNACGYGSYTTNSPATDASYSPNPAAPDWDYRVVYDVWVLKSALPPGWTVSIPYVHASPSKMASTYTVTSAPCPPLGCVGEGCSNGGTCVGESCDAGAPPFGGCSGEGCADAGECVGLLCDGGSPSQCVGELCNGGGGLAGDGGGNWCSPQGAVCTDSASCCSSLCYEGYCNGITRCTSPATEGMKSSRSLRRFGSRAIEPRPLQAALFSDRVGAFEVMRPMTSRSLLLPGVLLLTGACSSTSAGSPGDFEDADAEAEAAAVPGDGTDSGEPSSDASTSADSGPASPIPPRRGRRRTTTWGP